MRVAIIGGGLTGIAIAYFLATEGIVSDVFEASSVLGGLAGPLSLDDGTPIDRFYHAILSSDDHLWDLCRELGIDSELRFRETKNGFYVNGEIHSMNSAAEFLRFAPLSPVGRCRLAATIARAQLVRDWRSLEQIPVDAWLRRWSGKSVTETLWRPMLEAKFDGSYSRVPATWMWSRLVRMKSTRSGANQRESAGHLIGGYATLLAAMATRIRAAGGRIHLNCPVQEVAVQDGRATAVRHGQGVWQGSAVVCTMQAPVVQRLIPGAPQGFREALASVPYLGIVCPLVVMDRPLSPYWTLNIADSSVPFTGIIQTTAYIDPQYAGGHHLVYLPKYTRPGSTWQQLSDGDLREAALLTLQRIFPDFERRSVVCVVVNRERYVEPLHWADAASPVPPIETPVEDLFLATTAQIYPALTNGESITRHARMVAARVAARKTRAGHGESQSTLVPALAV